MSVKVTPACLPRVRQVSGRESESGRASAVPESFLARQLRVLKSHLNLPKLTLLMKLRCHLLDNGDLLLMNSWMANDIVYVYPALLLGGANVFFNLKLMSAERPKFLLDVVTRVDPQANICTFFYGYIPAVKWEYCYKFCNIDDVLYCCYIYIYIYILLKMMMRYRNAPVKVANTCKRSSAITCGNSLRLYVVVDVGCWRKFMSFFHIQLVPMKMFYLKFNNKWWHTAVILN